MAKSVRQQMNSTGTFFELESGQLINLNSIFLTKPVSRDDDEYVDVYVGNQILALPANGTDYEQIRERLCILEALPLKSAA